MIVFKDKITGDEIITDSFNMKLVDDLYYEVEGKYTTEKTDIPDALIGGNASADGVDEGGDESQAQHGVDIVMRARLQTTDFTSKTYKSYIKGYMAKILAGLEEEDKERAAFFKTEMAKCMKNLVLKKFSDWKFFTGESMNPDGLVVLLNYREDNTTPYVILFKDGLIAEKV